MKLPNLKISLATTALAFLAGAAIALTPSSPKTQNLRLADSTTTPTTSQSTPTTTTTDPTTTAPATTTTGTSSPTSTNNAPSGSTSSPSTGSPSTSGTTTNSTQQSAPAAPVTAVSASITDWTNPQPTASMGGVTGLGGGAAYPTTVQYEYCVWTYSDGSTQQQVYEKKYTMTPPAQYASDGSMVMTDTPSITCSVAKAPIQ